MEKFEGSLVVFEGIDGSGKSTQADRYAGHLSRRGRSAYFTRQPSTGAVGTLLRNMLAREIAIPASRDARILALLFAADRLDHVNIMIAPLMRRGHVVVCDRYDLSAIAYQSTSENGADVDWLRELNKFAPRPTVTVVMDVPPEVTALRRRARGGVTEIFDDEALQAALADAYLRAEELVPGDRVVHVDGSGHEDRVAELVAAAVDPIVEQRDS